MKEKILVGVVGSGFGRYGLVPAFRRDNRCSVVAVCSRSKHPLDFSTSSAKAPLHFSDFREMLKVVPLDVLAIAVPPMYQPEIALAAIKLRIPVFAEKPISYDLDSALSLLEFATNASVTTAVDFIFPELHTWQHARRLIVEGELGDIRHVMLDWRMESHDIARDIVSWKTNTNNGGGILSHFGSHCFYNLEWLFGNITCLSADLFTGADISELGETMASVSMKFQSGITGSMTLCSAALFGSGHRVEVYGNKGSLILSNQTTDAVTGFKLLFAKRGDANLTVVGSEVANLKYPNEDSRVTPVASLVGRFLDAISCAETLQPSFVDGVRVQRLIEAARRSHKERVWINV